MSDAPPPPPPVPEPGAPVPPGFRAGFVALVGRPNAGKSTLLNALLNAKLSIVSAKPQTTRHRILGIMDGPDHQACLLDTPGFVASPKDQLQEALRHTAKLAAHEHPDLLVVVVEPEKPDAETLGELSSLARGPAPALLVINKLDLPGREKAAAEAAEAFGAALKPAATFRISALKRVGVDQLRAEIVARLPESPPFYERGLLSDRWERFFAAELIREAVFNIYGEEVPHATAVVLEQFIERPGAPDLIRATLYVERDGQKGIIIGERGKALRELQDRALAAIEDFIGRRAELELWVKVRPNWRRDRNSLREFGYL